MTILRTVDEVKEATQLPDAEAQKLIDTGLSEFFRYKLYATFPGKSIIRVFNQSDRFVGYFKAVRADIHELA